MATNEQSTLGPIHPSQIKAEANEDEKKSNVLKREIVDVRHSFHLPSYFNSLIRVVPLGTNSSFDIPDHKGYWHIYDMPFPMGGLIASRFTQYSLEGLCCGICDARHGWYSSYRGPSYSY
jgi:hypothetical protein